MLGRLLNRAIERMLEDEDEFKAAHEGLRKLVESLNEKDADNRPKFAQIRDLICGLEKELDYWRVKVDLEIVPPEIGKLFELGTLLNVDDGVRTQAERKGHGLQRAIIFAMLRTWANLIRRTSAMEAELRARKSSDSIIFAIEEPELFLHPHAQRRLARTLDEISQLPQHQVLICTHSTHFVLMEKYQSIGIVTKHNGNASSTIRQCTRDLFEGERLKERKDRFNTISFINPDRAEMFFAKLSVFVEGSTEKTIIPFLAEKSRLFDPDISIIDCGSKHNLPLYVTIANAFKLPYAVIHDEDPLPDPIPATWNADKIKEKKRTFELNGEIDSLVCPEFGTRHMMIPDFEGVSGVSKNQGERKGKPLAALDHFKDKTESEIPTPLHDLIANLYQSSDGLGEAHVEGRSESIRERALPVAEV